PAYGPQNDVTLKMPAFEWVHVQLHQQKGMISLSPPTICNSAREGDTVVVHSMDRLARNLDDLRRLVQKLTQRGVRIEFLKEGL
ncbi:recombinase family protein, partial [Klebsiella pneumoniae]|nr:recombinase family protein [Klebsiella pneumoniae]